MSFKAKGLGFESPLGGKNNNTFLYGTPVINEFLNIGENAGSGDLSR